MVSILCLWILTVIIGLYIVLIHYRNLRKPPLFVKAIWILILIATAVSVTIQFLGEAIGQDYFYYLVAE